MTEAAAGARPPRPPPRPARPAARGRGVAPPPGPRRSGRGASSPLILLASLFAPWLSPYAPIAQDLRNTLQPPSWAHPFGTDNFGRDILSRVLHAAKLDLMIGVLCVLFPWMLGLALGRHRRLLRAASPTPSSCGSSTPSRAFPFLVMVIGIIAILGPGARALYIALTLAGWSIYARIVRAEVLVARKRRVRAGRPRAGLSATRASSLRHILPNVDHARPSSSR